MTKFKLQDIKNGWQDDTIAESYDKKRFTTLSGNVSDSLDKLAIKKGLSEVGFDESILDIPCGTGRITQYLHHTGYINLTGADISEQMLNVAKEKMKNRNIYFFKTEAEHTEFAADSFSAITSIRFMGHIPRNIRIEILREFHRVCSGPIIIEYPIRNSFAHAFKYLLRILTVRARLPDQWEWHDVSKSELCEELQEAGLFVSRLIRKLPFLSESTFVVAKRIID